MTIVSKADMCTNLEVREEKMRVNLSTPLLEFTTPKAPFTCEVDKFLPTAHLGDHLEHLGQGATAVLCQDLAHLCTHLLHLWGHCYSLDTCGGR